MRMVLIAVLTVAIGLGLYVRFAPTDPTAWHAMPEAMDSQDLPGGVMRVVVAREGDWERLHAVILETPRTVVLAGALEEGMITYVTRSRVFAFPDYTTIRYRETQIEVFGRLRFGVSDLGVNAARVDAWLDRIAE